MGRAGRALWRRWSLPLRPVRPPGPGAAFVVAYEDGLPIGCGAICPLEPGIGEIHRMFVEREARGRGIARRILDELERIAPELEYRAIRLETGTRQPYAIKLYEKAGYDRIAPYGQYRNDPLSLCFEKRLT